MKLEDQVCSLELAKKLKELGVKQESLFYWQMVRGPYRKNGGTWEIVDQDNADLDNDISAFTVAELGEMLPDVIDIGAIKGIARMVLVMGRTFGNEWRIDYRNEELCKPIAAFGKNEADARAKMLIYLIENKLIKEPS